MLPPEYFRGKKKDPCDLPGTGRFYNDGHFPAYSPGWKNDRHG